MGDSEIAGGVIFIIVIIICIIGYFYYINTLYSNNNCTGQYIKAGTTNTCVKSCSPGYISSLNSNQCVLSCSGTNSYISEDGTTCVISCPNKTKNNQCYSSCSIGTYSNGSMCTSCPNGTYSNSTGQSSCTPCPAGSSVDKETGSTLCTLCPAGSYAPNGLYNSCTLCPVGTYSLAPGSTSCKTASNYYKLNINQTTYSDHTPYHMVCNNPKDMLKSFDIQVYDAPKGRDAGVYTVDTSSYRLNSYDYPVDLGNIPGRGDPLPGVQKNYRMNNYYCYDYTNVS